MIDLIDLKLRYKEEKKDLKKIIDNILKKANFVLTEEVSEFEKSIAKYTNTKYCLGLNSGTDALMMSLMVSGIKKGDEIITTPISFIATLGALIHIGARPIFVDVDDDLNINPDLIEKAITKKTKAILPVHWGGKLCKMDKIQRIARKFNLKIIEDSAQGLGAFYKKKHAGTFSNISCFSAHPLKNLSAFGDGGFIITNNKTYYEKIKLFRNHGLKERDNSTIFGLNSRLDSLNAKILTYRLKKLNKTLEKRRRNVKLYKKLLRNDKIKIAQPLIGRDNSYVMFIVLCEERDLLQEYLKTKGVQSLIYYGKPLHFHPASKKLKLNIQKLPVAEKMCKKVLALPVHQYLKEKQIKYICAQINKFYKTL